MISRSPSSAVYASDRNGHSVMVCNHPTVEWTLDIKDIQDWSTTLGECFDSIPACHRSSVRSLIIAFEAMLIKHQRQHEEVVTEAPTIEDLIAYLATYARHV